MHTEDVSRVKYIILQHLPVFLQNTMAGETDSQLVNSVRRKERERGRVSVFFKFDIDEIEFELLLMSFNVVWCGVLYCVALLCVV